MSCRLIVYTRRSTDDDDHQALSLDAQQKECQAFAQHRNLRISEVIRESHSARRPGRPLFEQMLADVSRRTSRGERIAILAHKPDRLLRNLADWAKLNDLIDTGVELLFVTGSYPNNAQGKMAFGVNVLFAKYYVDNLSEEVHKGIREKLARGEWPAWAPLGYRNVPEKSAPERVVIDPETAPLVRRAFEYYATGEYSLVSLARQLEKDGLVGRVSKRRLTPGYLQERVLRNPFYCGLMRFRGQLHPGVHPPLITHQLFEAVQEQMRRGGRPRSQRHFFRYSGLFRCSNCGGAIVGDLKKGKYLYYRCSHRRGPCGEGYLRQEMLESKLSERIRERVVIGPDVMDALITAAERMFHSADHDGGAQRKLLLEQAARAERRLRVLLDLRLEGTLTDAEFAEKRAELLLLQAKTSEQLRRFELPAEDPRDAIDTFIRLCKRLETVLTCGEDTEIRTLLRIIGSNYRIGGGEIDFEPVEPFKTASQSRACPQWRPSEDEVRKIVSFMQAHESQLG